MDCLRSFVVLMVVGAVWTGCSAPPAPQEYVVRLGSETLTRDDLDQALGGISLEIDSADAARQVIEQWISNQLLFTEARRRGIDRDPEVRRDVLEAERAVVVDALLEEVYRSDMETRPTDAQVQEYFARNRERLRLVEPYVRIRYLVIDSVALAAPARRALSRLDSSAHRSWETLAEDVSAEKELSLSLSRALIPETRAFAQYPAVAQTLAATMPGRTTGVISDRGRLHIIQVIERIPAGTLPEPRWIASSLREQLQIESRKLLYARLVQRLRTEALAREQLDIRQ